jgi:hypothetical protein
VQKLLMSCCRIILPSGNQKRFRRAIALRQYRSNAKAQRFLHLRTVLKAIKEVPSR